MAEWVRAISSSFSSSRGFRKRKLYTPTLPGYSPAAFKAMFGHQAGIDTPQEGAAAFALMPNPATGTVRCIVPEEGFAAGTLTLHDAAGKEVLRQKIARPGTHDIDISALPAGVYFATLSTPQGTSTRRLAVE